MPLRDFSEVNYLPLLDVRPAELMALQQLPERDKDQLLPLFRLRPWVGAANLDSAVNRLRIAYGKRPCFLELGSPEQVSPNKEREVHRQLQELRDPTSGYTKWVSFLKQEGNENFIPVVQLGDALQFADQVGALIGLGRGLLIHVDVNRVDPQQFAALLSRTTDGGRGAIFLLDYFKQEQSFLSKEAEILAHVKSVLREAPNLARVALSASSFPDSFTQITSQNIYEREVFNALSTRLGDALLYSDRGSARAERQAGGGGLPAPRIDYAVANKWFFYRQNDPVKKPSMGYQRQAAALIDSDTWDRKLALWGCRMIEKTAIGDDTGITSPNRSTASRINIHLHQQLYYGDQTGLYETDEEWQD